LTIQLPKGRELDFPVDALNRSRMTLSSDETLVELAISFDK